MSIASTTNRNDYDADGTLASYPYTFRIFDEGDVLVTVRDTSDPAAVDQELVIDTDYTVTGVKDLAGGTIELVDAGQAWIDGDGDLEADWHITIRRHLDILQPTDIRNQGAYYAKLHEDALDRLTMICQQQQDEIDRSIKLAETEAPGSFDLTLPAGLASNPGAAIIVNATGDGLAIGPDAGDIAAAQANAAAAAASAAAASASATSAASDAASALYRWGGAVGGTADAITLTPSPALVAYTSGIKFVFVATGTNTGAATVNVSGLGVKSLKNLAGGALVAGEITSGRMYRITYDGTDFRVHDIAQSAAVVAQNLTASALGFSMVNGILQASVAGNALTVAIKTKAGTDPTATDPVYVLFRNTTAATGDYTVITISAATSFVVSSGSTLGATSATAFRAWIVGFNDAGTFRLGVINCLNGQNIYPLGRFPIASSTAEGGAGAADSAHVFYTGAAVTSKAYAILGHATYETGLAVAGTWDAVPTRLHLQAQADPLPGATIQVVRNQTGAVATGTTVIPTDDTIPQNTEGDEYMSQAITPTSAANRLLISATANGGITGASSWGMALFQDAIASALAAIKNSESSANVMDEGKLEHEMLAGTTSSTTFKIRIGGSAASTFTFNGDAATRIYGGVISSFIRISEILT